MRTSERAPLFEALRDSLAEASNAFEPRLQIYLSVLSKVELESPEQQAHTALLQRVTDVMSRLRHAMGRAAQVLGRSPRRDFGGRGGASGGGDADGEGSDDDDDFEGAQKLKPGYQSFFVDPDAGWEKPPQEALDPPPPAASSSAPAPPAAAAVRACDSVSPGVASTSAAALVADPADITGSVQCGAARRDGSLCQRCVSAEPCVPCPFHGAWVERNKAGLPLAPAGVWAHVARSERAANEAAAAGVEAVQEEAGAEAEFDAGASRQSLRGTAAEATSVASPPSGGSSRGRERDGRSAPRSGAKRDAEGEPHEGVLARD